MRLELDCGDLKTERANVNCSMTRLEDFKEEVQAAIRIVGKATLYEDKGGRNEIYNVIYPT